MKAAALALAATLGGCALIDAASSAPDASGPAMYTRFIVNSNNADVLFVIDDSLGMADKQSVFASQILQFVMASGDPNLHVGIVSSSVDIGTAAFGAPCQLAGENGLFQSSPRAGTCTAPTGRYLVDIASGTGRTVNYTGTLDMELACLLPLGTGGCGFEAPLEAAKRALDGTHPENAGFLRPDALLELVFLTDEDDCSDSDPALFTLDPAQAGPGDFRCQPEFAYDCDQPISPTEAGTYHNCTVKTGSYLRDPSYYHDFFAGLKLPGQVVVAMVAGDPTSDLVTTGPLTTPFTQSLALLPSCTATVNGNQNIGRPGIRLNDFTQRFGDYGVFDTVCQPSYENALANAGIVLTEALGPCLDGPVSTLDTDPSNAGLQPACTISDVIDANTPAQAATAIVACPMADASTPAPGGPRPCWWIDTDPTVCMRSPHLDLHVERSGPSNDEVEVQCATAP